MGFDNIKDKNCMLQGNFGLEKENLRVNRRGNLAHTPHPFVGDKQIDRDFCENQVEFITKVYPSPQEAWEALYRLQKRAEERLLKLESGTEYLWPFSNPPYVRGEDDIYIAQFFHEQKDKTVYRNYLAEKYGKKKMLYSGIHYNFSFEDTFLEELFETERNQPLFQRKKNELYMNLAGKMFGYSWLIVYLMAASPVYDGSFETRSKMGETVKSEYISPRCSKIGYWNDFIPVLDYEYLSDYVDSIETLIREGRLKSASELYIPIRLKPKGVNTLERLKEYGVDHIELRMLDLNPLSPAGIMKEDLEFIHLLLVYAAFKKRNRFTVSEQMTAVKNMQHAAKRNEDIYIELSKTAKMKIDKAALLILNDMKAFFERLEVATDTASVIEYQMEKVRNPEKRYATKVINQFGENYVEKGIALAKAYAGQE